MNFYSVSNSHESTFKILSLCHHYSSGPPVTPAWTRVIASLSFSPSGLWLPWSLCSKRGLCDLETMPLVASLLVRALPWLLIVAFTREHTSLDVVFLSGFSSLLNCGSRPLPQGPCFYAGATLLICHRALCINYSLTKWMTLLYLA